MKLSILSGFFLISMKSITAQYLNRKMGFTCLLLGTTNCCNVDGCWTVQKKLIEIFKNEKIPDEKKVYLLRNCRFLVFFESFYQSFKNVIIFMMPLLGVCYYLLKLRLSTTIFIGEVIFLENLALLMCKHSREAMAINDEPPILMNLFGFFTGLIITSFLAKVNAVYGVKEVIGDFCRITAEVSSENFVKVEKPVEDVIKEYVHDALKGENVDRFLFGKVFKLWGFYTPVKEIKECFENLIGHSTIFAILLSFILVVDFFAFGYGFFNVMSVSLGLYIFWVFLFFFNNIPSDYK